jgi:hypothetical protein
MSNEFFLNDKPEKQGTKLSQVPKFWTWWANNFALTLDISSK